jgi:hypothetical protein
MSPQIHFTCAEVELSLHFSTKTKKSDNFPNSSHPLDFDCSEFMIQSALRIFPEKLFPIPYFLILQISVSLGTLMNPVLK